MSRILNNASLAAVALTAAAMLMMTEPGRATSLPTASALPVAGAPAATDPAAAQDPSPAAPAEPAPQAPEAEAAPAEPRSLAALVAATPAPDSIDDELRCLATAIYFESRSESLVGQLAVAHVVINRAASGRFPASLCGVVRQPRQFSFVRGGRMPPVDAAGRQWRTALAIARIALDGSWDTAAPGALFFHARHVAPGWNRPRVAQIDNHIFYR